MRKPFAPPDVQESTEHTMHNARPARSATVADAAPKARRQALATAALALAAAALLAAHAPSPAHAAGTPATTALATVAVGAGSAAPTARYEGHVEAVRQTVLSAQVPGAIVELPVKAGDTVKAGQLLVRLDARAAQQTAAAGAAQAQAARAMLEAATREFERQKQLFDKHYISQAALDRAEAQYKASQAEAQAQLANAGAASTQSSFYVLKAPYAGIVADVPVVLGDMAMPGRPLVTVYDPAALRVTVALPETAAATLRSGATPTVQLPGIAAPVKPSGMQLLPTADPATHTFELRLDLPAGLAGVMPGQFAAALVATPPAAGATLSVPLRAVVRRAELTGVYVVGADGKPQLRQVRLGRASGDQVEVLAGVTAGERVAVDPQAAAQVR